MTTKVIHEAELAAVNQLGPNSAEFVIRPLFYGYGNTLGNSIRRVLLSSIKGAASSTSCSTSKTSASNRTATTPSR